MAACSVETTNFSLREAKQMEHTPSSESGRVLKYSSLAGCRNMGTMALAPNFNCSKTTPHCTNRMKKQTTKRVKSDSSSKMLKV
jgi:hypothetical protein